MKRGTSLTPNVRNIDASVAKRLVSYQRVCPGKEMLGRVVAMLTRLVDRFDAKELRVRQDVPAS